MCDAERRRVRRGEGACWYAVHRVLRAERDAAKPPLGQRARREVSRIPAGFVAEHLVMGTPFAVLWHAGHAVGMTEDGAQRLLHGGSTARRRAWLGVLRAVQREVKNG